MNDLKSSYIKKAVVFPLVTVAVLIVIAALAVPKIIASLPVDGGEGRYSLSFSVPAPGNCDIGIETDGETSSSAILFSANLCGGDGLPGYSRVENVDDGEKIIYFYKDFKY